MEVELTCREGMVQLTCPAAGTHWSIAGHHSIPDGSFGMGIPSSGRAEPLNPMPGAKVRQVSQEHDGSNAVMVCVP